MKSKRHAAEIIADFEHSVNRMKRAYTIVILPAAAFVLIIGLIVVATMRVGY